MTSGIQNKEETTHNRFLRIYFRCSMDLFSAKCKLGIDGKLRELRDFRASDVRDTISLTRRSVLLEEYISLITAQKSKQTPHREERNHERKMNGSLG